MFQEPGNDSSAGRFAEVILPLAFPASLTYGVPDELRDQVQEGMRVEVALGRNKKYAGVVASLHGRRPDTYQIKPVLRVLDSFPIVNPLQLKFWSWVSAYYMAAPGDVMNAALPAHLKLSSETRLEWAPEDEDVFRDWSEQAMKAVAVLREKKELTLPELRDLVGEPHMTDVIQELLEKETVLIRDSLESSYRPKKEKFVILHPDYGSPEKMAELFAEVARAPRQEAIVQAYIQLRHSHTDIPKRALLEKAASNSAAFRSLLDKGVFLEEERHTDRIRADERHEPAELAFTPAQQTAYDEVCRQFSEKEVVLLQGVTGSGKTLLYVQLIRECLEQGKQALLLLPEIALTTQLVRRLYAFFGGQLGVYHSRFTNNERVEIWEKVRRGNFRIVVGPRSALWLPFDSLGLIIVDEEHDASYKQQDPAPRFHARDSAVYLGAMHGAKLLLGSATPSVETLYHARHGKYGYVKLAERYMGVRMPAIEILNAGGVKAMKDKGFKLLTPELYEAIRQTLDEKRQVILFQNRRGYAPMQLCTVCGWIPQCRNCSVSLSYHKATDKLHCHYCGLQTNVIHACLACGNPKMVSKSFGTEKIEEEMQAAFPKARVARMDVDSMRRKQSMPELLEKLEKKQVDILVGTQMVVKGLDLEGVRLIGVLSADSLLSYPDFRVNERAFQLMEQVAGRSGRSDGSGRVMIQVYNQQHPVLKWVQEHDVEACYQHEIASREQFSYPPFVRMIRVLFKHYDEQKAVTSSTAMADGLRPSEGFTVHGPAPALVSKVRNQYIQEIWIRCSRDPKILGALKRRLMALRQDIHSQRGLSSVQIVFDVDPVQ